VVEGNGVEDSALKGQLGDVVAGISKSLKSGEELLCILFRRLKFTDYGFRELHQKHICEFYHLSFKPQFPPPINNGGFLEVV
jgi:hypothetical protein